MKHILLYLTLAVFSCAASLGEDAAAKPVANEVIHVATALDHLTVLEFAEPVTMAAAGSQSFDIERHDNKVFVRPLKPGASTDLFVWTASRRFAYELEAPGEVEKMNFAIDSHLPEQPKPAPELDPRLDQIADMMLTKALLGAEHINSKDVKEVKDGITLRVEHIFQSRNTLYIHYSVVNRGGRPYRVSSPTILELNPTKSGISLTALKNTQLNRELVEKLGRCNALQLSPAHTEVEHADVGRDDSTQGIIAIRQKPDASTVLKIVFGSNGKHPVEAVVVL